MATEPEFPIEQPADDVGHLLPDDEWARVVAEAHSHPDNPHNPGGDR
jgi:hypothetical protein